MLLLKYYKIRILLIILYVINSYGLLSQESQIETLKEWLKRTDNMITLKSLTRGKDNDVNKYDSTFPARIYGNQIIPNLTTKMNDRVSNITCTYVILAQKHLRELYKIVDNDLSIQEISILVANIKHSYLNVTLKMATTLSNIGYDQPPWIINLIRFLKKDDPINVLDGLADVLLDLIEYHAKFECTVTKLNLNNFYTHIHIMYTFNFEAEELLTINFIDEFYKAKTMQVGNWLSNNNLTKYIRTKYHIQNHTSIAGTGPNHKIMNNNRLCGTFLYQTLSQIIDKVYFNILDTQFILEQNKLILSFSGYDRFEYDSLSTPLNKIEKTIDSSPETNEKIKNLLSLKSKVISIMSNRIWYDKFASRIDELNEGSTNLKSAIQFSSLSLKLKKSIASIMDKVHKAYFHHYLVHFNESLRVLEHIKLIKNKNYKSNTDLILSYYEITLMIVASFYNSNWIITDWMFKMIFYMQEIKDIVDSNRNVDINTLISKIKTIIKMLNEFHSKINPIDYKPRMLDIKIEQSDNDKTEKLYVPIVREFYLLPSTDLSRKSYAEKMYLNLIQLAYLLDINSEYFQYNGFENFKISNWKLPHATLTGTTLDNFRWDDIEKESSWFNRRADWTYRESAVPLLDPKNNELFPMNYITKSLNIYNNLMDLTQIVIIRFSLGFLIQCHNINQIRDSATIGDSIGRTLRTLLNKYCGLDGSFIDDFKDFLKSTGLINAKLFNLLLKEMELFKFDQTNKIFTESISTIVAVKKVLIVSKFAIQKLNELAITFNFPEIGYPIVPIKSYSSSLTDTSEPQFMTRALKFRIAITEFMKAYRQVFYIRLDIHKFLMKSLENYRPIEYYVE